MRNLFIISLVLCAAVVRADLPVHCLKHQVVGKWKLETTESKLVTSPHQMKCGHDEPDNPQNSAKAFQDQFEAAAEVNVNLNDDDTVQHLDDSSVEQGEWTMVYDEGFEINVGNVKYFSFSKYVMGENAQYQSQCGATLIGWFHDFNSGEMGCYRATKVDGENDEVSDNVDQAFVVQPKEYQDDAVVATDDSDDSASDASSSSSSDDSNMDLLGDGDSDALFSWADNTDDDGPRRRKHNKRHHAHFSNLVEIPQLTLNSPAPVPLAHHHDVSSTIGDYEYLELKSGFTAHHKVVDRLNNVDSMKWQAHAYPAFAGLSIKELNKKAGRKKFHAFVQMGKAQSKNENSHFELEDVSDLPASFDWKQYLPEAREQGDCGSCYAFATIHMLEARLKIKYGDDTKLSIQHPLDCSYYNQGCDGGYPFLVEKFASENELVPESCHPYRASNGKCSATCDTKALDKTYKVDKYWFVGGAYGKSTERNMMLELKRNGPIVVSFEPKYDFMHYKSGIYHSVDANDWILNGEAKPEWEKVDHSVLCYGWGEENGEKYWLLMNWWGNSWGEDGFFRMRRGSDESNIESLAEAADPVIIKKEGAYVQTHSNNNSLRGRSW